MTRRRDLENHRHNLAEIRGIMNSMKTLAYMETRKVARFLDAQHAVVQSIENVVFDLLSFYPETLPKEKETTPVYLLMGTDRGFCGDFNHALLRFLESSLPASQLSEPMLIAIGRKLYTLLEDDVRIVAMIDGAGVLEEMTSLLNQLVAELTKLQLKHGVITVYCIYHSTEDNIVIQKLLPPFENLLNKSSRLPHPPDLNESPRELLLELTDHYLFATLYEILYTSFMLENHHRVTHLDGAVRHLDDESAKLAQQCNALRQEEIIEEIEVILLSAASLGEPAGE